jgi:hypothetical protein
MLRTLGWLPLLLGLATPTFAARIDVADVSGFGPVIAQINIPGPDGYYADGSYAIGHPSHLPDFFSEVRFNGTHFTYIYGVSRLVSCNCDLDYFIRSKGGRHLSGELLGGTLRGTWGNVLGYRMGFADFQGLLANPVETATGITYPGFGSADVVRFYLQVEESPRWGLLRGFYRFNHQPLGFPDGEEEPLPPLFATIEDAVYVPTPEPGTLALCGLGLAVATCARRWRRRLK